MTALIEADAPKADAPPKAMTTDTITDRVAALTAVVERERLARAVALLDGGPFDATALTDAEAALEALGDASGELTRRERTALAEQAATARNALRDTVPPLLAKWLAAIDEQEASARAMIAASAQADRIRTEIEMKLKALFGRSELLLTPQVQIDRRSRSLAALLQKHVSAGYYGEMLLPACLTAADEAWSLQEQQIVQAITLQLKEDANDPTT